MEEIPPTHYAASRAASVAENCINYQQGTPHKVFLVQTVQQASKEVSLRDGEAQRIGLPSYSHPDPGWAGLGWAGLSLVVTVSLIHRFSLAWLHPAQLL